MFRADADRTGFSFAGVVSLGGLPVPGKFARYVPATGELFFSRSREGSKQDEICVIRNFDLASLETTPATPARRTDDGESAGDTKALQGDWISVSEESGGKKLSKA